jgi:aminoglycoside phosphotransferase (APT) family kinase protein
MATLSQEDLRVVATVLEQKGQPVEGRLEATQIAGGRSNLTFRLQCGEAHWVLRMPPRAGRTPSAHDVAREFRVTAALAGAKVPVPETIALCEDESLLGVPFIVTEFVRGRTVQSRRDLDALSDATLDAIVRTLIETLAALHQVDHVGVGLETFGRPTGYSARQLRRWRSQWELMGSRSLDSLALGLASALEGQVPEQGDVSLLHGDFRIDNTLLDLQPTPRVAAVLDWELSTIGEPAADVAMMCAYRHPSFDSIVGAPSAWTSPRLPNVSALLSAYESEAGGVALAHWEFHLALAYFKVAVIAAGIDHRYRAGSGHGPGFSTAGQAVEPLLQAGAATIGASR